MTQKKKVTLYVWVGIIIALVILFLTQCVFVPRCSHERIRENGETYEVYDGIRYQTLKDDTAWRVDYAAFTEKIGCGMLACPTDPNRTVLVYESVGCASMGMLPLIRADRDLPEPGKTPLFKMESSSRIYGYHEITDPQTLEKLSAEFAGILSHPVTETSFKEYSGIQTKLYFEGYPQLYLSMPVVLNYPNIYVQYEGQWYATQSMLLEKAVKEGHV